MKKLFIIFLFLFFVSLSTVYAADIYVDGGWGGTESGTVEEPYDTIGEGITAINALGDGAHNLYIAGGYTYDEDELSVTTNGSNDDNRVTIQPWSGEGNVVCEGDFVGHGVNKYFLTLNGNYQTIKKGTNEGFTVQNYEKGGIRQSGDYDIVDGLTITDCVSSESGSAGVVAGDYGQILNCSITCKKQGVYILNVTGSSGNEITIDGNTFVLSPSTGSSGMYGVRIYDDAQYNTDYLIISDNDISMDAGTTTGDTKGIGSGRWGDDNWLIDGNTIYNSGAHARKSNSIGIEFLDISTTIISDNIIYNWGHYGIDVGGAPPNQSQGITIERNLVYNNDHGNIAVDGGTVGAVTPITVKNNVVYQTIEPLDSANNYNGLIDFHFYEAAGTPTAQVDVYNNTCWANVERDDVDGLWTDGHLGTGTYNIKNNIFIVKNGMGINWQDTDGENDNTVIDYNIAYETGTGYAIRWRTAVATAFYANDEVLPGGAESFADDTGQMSNAVEEIPTFADAPTDFSLASGSSAIDKGINIYGVTVDYLGISRPAGLNTDVGAYEFEFESESGAPGLSSVGYSGIGIN